METKKKIAALACAAALCTASAVPAFADTISGEGGTAKVPIYATVVPEGADVISVVMPAQIPLSIYLDGEGALDTATTKPVDAEVQNLAASTKSVKVTLDGVTDEGNLLSQIKLDMNGVNLATATANAELIAKIEPGANEFLTLKPSAVSTGKLALVGSTYTVSTVVKATAI